MKKLLAALILTAGIAFAQFSVGVHIGEPPRPRVIRVRPNSPGPGYTWVDGYWYPQGNRYTWHQGYWTRPPYEGSQWSAPTYDNGSGMCNQGYWNGNNGRVEHDHQWDRDRQRRDYQDHHDNGRHDDH